MEVTVRINLRGLTTNILLVIQSVDTFPVTTTRYIPWVEFVFPSLRFGRL